MTHDPVSKTASPYGFLTICSTLAWALGYFGMPHILLRFMAIEDHNKLKLSRRIAVIWVVIAMGVAILIGIIGNAMTKVGAVPLLEGSASETIIVCISEQAWLPCGNRCRYCAFRYSGGNHVHGGFSASGGILQYFP